MKQLLQPLANASQQQCMLTVTASPCMREAASDIFENFRKFPSTLMIVSTMFNVTTNMNESRHVRFAHYVDLSWFS